MPPTFLFSSFLGLVYPRLLFAFFIYLFLREYRVLGLRGPRRAAKEHQSLSHLILSQMMMKEVDEVYRVVARRRRLRSWISSGSFLFLSFLSYFFFSLTFTSCIYPLEPGRALLSYNRNDIILSFLKIKTFWDVLDMFCGPPVRSVHWPPWTGLRSVQHENTMCAYISDILPPDV